MSPDKSNSNYTKPSSERAVDIVEEWSPVWMVENTNYGSDAQLRLIEKIRSGVTKHAWKQLLSNIGATEKELECILPTSISSMQKREVYAKETSERIYQIARLFGLGHEVFDTKEDFRNWLHTPSKVLGGVPPFELLDSSLGFSLVENAIERVRYNVYS